MFGYDAVGKSYEAGSAGRQARWRTLGSSHHRELAGPRERTSRTREYIRYTRVHIQHAIANNRYVKIEKRTDILRTSPEKMRTSEIFKGDEACLGAV